MNSDSRVDRARRRILVSGTAIFTGALSGCSTISDWRETQIEQKKEKIPRLCERFELMNGDSEPHKFHVLIERDGEVMKWWSSDEIPAHTGISVNLGDWHTTRGEYVIYGSYDEYPVWDRENVSQYELDGKCFRGAIQIDADGSVWANVYDDEERSRTTDKTTQKAVSLKSALR